MASQRTLAQDAPPVPHVAQQTAACAISEGRYLALASRGSYPRLREHHTLSQYRTSHGSREHHLLSQYRASHSAR
eukprot:1225053-Rhodomonas_salina.1